MTTASHVNSMTCLPKLVLQGGMIVINSNGHTREQADEIVREQRFVGGCEKTQTSFDANDIMDLFVSGFSQLPETSHCHYDCNTSGFSLSLCHGSLRIAISWTQCKVYLAV
jgi:hypothetical protein